MTRDKIKIMLELQDSMNSKVNPDWKLKRWCWADAIVVEGAEGIESAAFKWWKKQDLDVTNMKMEAIDNLHFIMSMLIEYFENEDDFGYNLEDFMYINLQQAYRVDVDFNYRLATRKTIMYALLFEDTPTEESASRMVYWLGQTLKSVDMRFDDVYKLYIVKNILNKFRQDNGYKEGTYIKQWGNVEDNVVVTEHLYKDGITPEELYTKMEAFYQTLSK